MKRVILMRHAKSSWDDLTVSDHDRTLNDRGRRSATMIGQWLSDNSYIPQSVLSSSANRCIETWVGVERVLQTGLTPTIDNSLYHSHVGMLVEKLAQATTDTVLILGHNPTMGEFASHLLETPPRDSDMARYPTAATTVIDFDIDNWSDVGLRTGTLVDFTIPKKLTS